MAEHVYDGSSFMPAVCPVCGSVGAEALMHEHIEAEHPERVEVVAGRGRSPRTGEHASVKVVLNDG